MLARFNTEKRFINIIRTRKSELCDVKQKDKFAIKSTSNDVSISFSLQTCFCKDNIVIFSGIITL